MADPTEPAWAVVVPVKRAAVAKSRLTGVSAQQRAELAVAFPADCVAAARAADPVSRVVVVTDDPEAAATMCGLGAGVVADTPDAGLNPALEHGRAFVREQYGDLAVAVLSGDLPALRPDELARALRRAGTSMRAFLADRAGDGTTLLTAPPHLDLDPHFGAGSRERHLASGARELDPDGLAGARRDVDTWDDLREAVGLGVGSHTWAVLERHGLLAALAG
ncbi:MAG: 2-phospho-L-lactate guanylyltransferase [Actinomycetota bacterium]|nr:2-phospho-L-lactate guanylyltransferase [Actinomycetota bacterium]